MIYLVTILLLLVFVLRYDINGKKQYRNECYLLILIIFILIAGLRWRLMVDTPSYLYSFYHRYPDLDYFSFDEYPLGKDPLWVLINSCVKSLGGRYYWVQLIEATFVNTLIFKYFKRHSRYIFTCVFFYAIINYFNLSMEIMRGAFSVVICLYAYDYILDKKWFKGYLLLFIALFFHAQTILMFILPALFFLRLNKKGVAFLVGAFFIGLLLSRVLRDYIGILEFSDAIEAKASGYAESERFSQMKGGIGNFLYAKLPYLLYTLVSLLYVKSKKPLCNLLKLEPLVILGLFFVIVRINFEIAYRYVDYFHVYFILFLSEFLIDIIYKAKYVDLKLACLRAFVIFLPFFFLVGFAKNRILYAFYPYSSVIEKRIDREREIKYAHTNKFTPPASNNEY